MKKLEDFYWKLDGIANKFPPYNIMVKYRFHVSLLYATLTALMFSSHMSDFKSAAPVIAFSLWHFSLYMYNRYTDKGEDTLNSKVEAMDDFHGKIAVYLTFIMLASGFGLLIFCGYTPVYYLISLPFVFIYGQPLFGGKLRIKTITLVKNLFSAVFCWALPTLLVGLTYGGDPLDFTQYPWGSFKAMFFGIMIYELLWDLRDTEGDRLSRVMTVPVRYGEAACNLLVALLLLGAYFFHALSVPVLMFLAFFSIIIHQRCAPILTHIMILIHLFLFNGKAFTMFF
jgi:4-hydroxybenzoate polyprenyltransferase